MKSSTRVMLGAAGTGAALFAPAAVQTVRHARSLKLGEERATARERAFGQRFPELDTRPREDKSMEEVMENLAAVPFKPGPLGGLVSTLMFSLPDVIPMLLETRKSTCGRVYRYPTPFEKVIIHSEDGTPLSAVVAVHDDRRRRPALLMVHGLFGSKNIWFSQQVVLSAYYGWGYNVMALDLRFFGESKRLSDAPGTGGWKEGQDIIAAVRYLKGLDGVTSVGVMGGSYGGASAMCAAYQSEPKDLIDGGIISWGGYGYVPEQVRFISRTPKPTEPYFPIYLFFMTCFLATLGERALRYRDFEDLLRGYSATYYGVDPDELMDRSSAALHFDGIETPLLVINAEDDPIIPISQATLMEEKARGNPWVEVLRMPKGGHCAFVTVDRDWTSAATRKFFDYWAEPGGQA